MLWDLDSFVSFKLTRAKIHRKEAVQELVAFFENFKSLDTYACFRPEELAEREAKLAAKQAEKKRKVEAAEVAGEEQETSIPARTLLKTGRHSAPPPVAAVIKTQVQEGTKSGKSRLKKTPVAR